jgi:thiamine-phosphate diphosphorylase
MRNSEALFGLHVVTDNRAVKEAPVPHDLVDAVAMVLDGGATVIQYRNKDGTPEERLEDCEQLVPLIHRRGALLIVNGDIEAALATEADGVLNGVHICPEEGPVSEVRNRIGSQRLLGVSVEAHGESLREIKESGADYAGLTVFRSKRTKPRACTIGLEGVRRSRHETSLPIVAIGGINLATMGDVFEAGADAVAVVGAALRQTNPESATRELVMMQNLSRKVRT